MADLTWNVVCTPKWSSLAGVLPLGLNAQPFLRSQGPRMGYTSELYQCGFEAIEFVCRKSTMMEFLCAGDSSSCRWVVLVSPGFPFSSVVMFNRFIWAALWIHIMGIKVRDCSRYEQLNKSVYGWQMETQYGKTKYQYWYFPTLWPHLRFFKIYISELKQNHERALESCEDVISFAVNIFNQSEVLVWLLQSLL